jgi:hypothetical protein
LEINKLFSSLLLKIGWSSKKIFQNSQEILKIGYNGRRVQTGEQIL